MKQSKDWNYNMLKLFYIQGFLVLDMYFVHQLSYAWQHWPQNSYVIWAFYMCGKNETHANATVRSYFFSLRLQILQQHRLRAADVRKHFVTAFVVFRVAVGPAHWELSRVFWLASKENVPTSLEENTTNAS